MEVNQPNNWSVCLSVSHSANQSINQSTSFSKNLK